MNFNHHSGGKTKNQPSRLQKSEPIDQKHKLMKNINIRNNGNVYNNCYEKPMSTMTSKCNRIS